MSAPTVKLEYYSWMAKELMGVSEKGTTVDVELVGGHTVRELLADMAGKSEKFHELVYDPVERRLKEYATLIVNGRVVELVPGGLDSRLQPGDKLLLLPGFSGG
jgi:molybdopterin converting factor small subunit